MKNLIIGVGEVGGPLLELSRDADLDVQGIDIEPVEVKESVDVMHICVPFKDEDEFVKIAVDYIKNTIQELQ